MIEDLKKSITGDENYQLGDLSKKAIMKYVGKETYSLGDITRKALEDKKSGNAKQLLKDINTDFTKQELALRDATTPAPCRNVHLTSTSR